MTNHSIIKRKIAYFHLLAVTGLSPDPSGSARGPGRLGADGVDAKIRARIPGECEAGLRRPSFVTVLTRPPDVSIAIVHGAARVLI